MKIFSKKDHSMSHTIRNSLWALPLLLVGVAFGQSVTVPAIPGATASSPGASGPTPEQIQAQLQQTNEQLAKLRANIAESQGAMHISGLQPGLPAPVDAGAAAAGSPTTPVATTGGDVPRHRAIPQTPSAEEVAHLEQQLSRARSQRRAESVTEAGMITANSASAMRAEVVFPYVENSIYEILAAPDRMTAIELQPGEVISTDNGKPKAADTVQWIADTVTAGEGADRRIIVMVKPIMTGIETNMLIPTNRHVYSILLRAQSRAYMPLVAFSYAADEAKVAASAGRQAIVREAARETVSVAPEDMNFAYRVKGAKVVWTPVRVFDDGSKTYLQMPPEMKSWESPALFVMEDKKTPELVNYRVKGDYYIVDRLFHQAQLRVGAKKFVDIYRDDRAGG
jgi:P-type conjugative transfer protein TrbG